MFSGMSQYAQQFDRVRNITATVDVNTIRLNQLMSYKKEKKVIVFCFIWGCEYLFI